MCEIDSQGDGYIYVITTIYTSHTTLAANPNASHHNTSITSIMLTLHYSSR